MAKHQESAAKLTIRGMLLDACERLQRGNLTYLGLPAESALDIKVLSPVLENVICIADRAGVLEETRRSIAALQLKTRKYYQCDMWEYLHKQYPSETLVADVTYLDFYGGGIVKNNPFANEIHGLRSFFARQANYLNTSFVLAWFFMPRDKGKAIYVDACRKIIPKTELKLLENAKGVWARSIAVRLLLRQSLIENDMNVSVFQHALYKRAMNTIIIVFSKGKDQNCKLTLGHPDELLTAPVVSYIDGQRIPSVIQIPGT